ncbi:MAG: chromosome segregation protein SMC [Rhizobiaceae bacterium]|nr:chromosome segregation protein SMC [Rhizobiaceae bacterium]MCV0405673.1 chromosome segregation protein SMC [Rhizobiaceae bacterium]
MRFQRLRLLGFKSFVESSEFVIEAGLTGVVGPNGCGKSNLVEALRWVMGENSYKNMRASGMDDVIFSGSATRPSRNTAEVTLFLDNSDRTAPAAFNDQDELQVSRRIEREAGSIYRINGREARARDVQLLFADQSTGARSPSMVGQGRIGELIQAKPQARRALLEEAAGISGLHTRRHEAELRLRAAEQNLERLDDVTGELESQIENLRRQARQAIRFRNISADIRKAEATLFHLRWVHAKTQEAEAQSALNQATSAVADAAAHQMEAAKAQAVGQHRLPELRETEAKAAAALQRLSIARGELDAEAERIAARRADLEKRKAQLASDMSREEQLLRDNAEILERLAAEEHSLKAEEEGADAREAELRTAFEEAADDLARGEALLSRLTNERAEAAAALAQIERATQDARQRLSRAEQQLADIVRQQRELDARLSALPDPAEKQAQVEVAEAALTAAETEAVEAEKASAEARQAEAATRLPLQDARAALQRIETEARTLAKVLGAGTPDLFPAVLEQVTVERGFETALGAALGEDLDAPLDRTAPAHWGDSSIQPGDPALPDGARPLIELVRAPRELARRLSQIGLVAEDDGPRLQPLLRPGQRLVSETGALWRWDGFTASADAPTPAAQRLAQKNRLAELDAEAGQARESLARAERSQAEAEAAARGAAEAERIGRETWRAAQKKLGEAREALSAAEKAAGDLVARRAALEEAHARLEESRREAVDAKEAADLAARDAPDLAEQDRTIEAATAEVAGGRGRLAEARAAHDGLKRETEARRRRLEAIAGEARSWVARAGNAESQMASLRERRAEIEADLASLADAPGEIEARRRALLSELSKADAARRDAADALQKAENEQADLDKAATDAIQALAGSREARARAEERLTAAADRRADVEARIRDTIGVEPHLAIGNAGLKPDDDLPEAGDVERRLERLRIERERLGAVNLRAEDEQRELSERLETIVAERDDVIEAIKRLRQAIQNLNREGRERLVAAFEVVNREFQRLFTRLFGGGTAELQLIESDDPLEAGLEILARPPGKKPQTMTLLSGGEQALTAMALIFAVFLTNPAPICVLDEVDAPLDDHNVERFCNLMDEMAASTRTRFILITHNPITMARMNRLYGVTMAEQGVSQLVSVDLETAEQLREAS